MRDWATTVATTKTTSTSAPQDTHTVKNLKVSYYSLRLRTQSWSLTITFDIRRNIKWFAEENNYDLIRFDYFGHGNSSREFLDGSIGEWLENSLNMADK